MCGVTIPSLEQCKDLGVIFSSDLSWSQHYSVISAKAYCKLGLLRRTFSSLVPVDVKKQLYLSLVRSQLSYCSPVWRSHLLRDIKSLETIQRCATKYILCDYASDYRDRLINLHILPLMYRFELHDILFLVKALKSPDKSFPLMDHIKFATSTTRSASSSKLVHVCSKTTLGHHSYFSRVVRLWNSLPPIDLSLSYSTIKYHLKKIFWSHFLSNFNSTNPCTYPWLCPCHNCNKHPATTKFSHHSNHSP